MGLTSYFCAQYAVLNYVGYGTEQVAGGAQWA